MSTDAPHIAAGRSFLGNLVERTQPRASPTPLPILERRRPGIFEPRGPSPANRLDITETTIAPSAPSLSRVAAPAMQPPAPAPRTQALEIAAPTPPAMANATATRPMASPPQLSASSGAERRAAPSPPPAMAAKPHADTTTAATRSPRKNVGRDTPVPRPSALAPERSGAALSVSPPTAIAAPPAISARSAQVVRVERSRLESRTTIIEREIDKHRDPPTPAVPAPTLMPPPRLASREAPRSPVAHPARSAAVMAAPPVPAAPAPVQVSIGRVEIRGLATSAPIAARSAAPKPQLGLDEYLRQRHGNGR
jgi:hypothetical protein